MLRVWVTSMIVLCLLKSMWTILLGLRTFIYVTSPVFIHFSRPIPRLFLCSSYLVHLLLGHLTNFFIIFSWSRLLAPPPSSVSLQFSVIYTGYLPEHVSRAERGASEERSVQNIVGARSGFLSKGWSDRSVSLRFRSDTAHTTSLGHAQIHPEFTCQQLTKPSAYTLKIVRCEGVF